MKYDIVISSCSLYSDCWEFLDISLGKVDLSKFRVTLITDRDNTDCGYTNFELYETNNLDWSTSLIECLKRLKGKSVLFLQEDYFLHEFDNNQIYKKFEELEDLNEGACCYLNNSYVEHKKNGNFRGCSLQAGIWNRIKLIELSRKFPNPWCFEVYGSLYTRLHRIAFTCSRSPMISYTFTAINRGKWSDEGKDFIKAISPDFDFSFRGFYSAPGYFSLKFNLLIKIVDLRSVHVRQSLRSLIGF